ncbi:hypothetical protein [Agromyces mariniharenae]|uniref:Uncharacterized protein n=1 Tax=Agromyces mariniharenae TaxID=2604423 RepID=A0A5S4UX66_9MICO|nr:hypothetical protein [Agromyces mariniharenae]TYL50259.1 hypothetical protein FYC51_13630 [Agromyces mariniharenae]
MLQASIRIEGRDHFLPPGDSADAVMGRITEQLRAGGGFVEIIRTPDRSVRVLVSPGMSLSIEVADVDDDPSEPAAEVEVDWRPQAWFSSIDLL